MQNNRFRARSHNLTVAKCKGSPNYFNGLLLFIGKSETVEKEFGFQRATECNNEM